MPLVTWVASHIAVMFIVLTVECLEVVNRGLECAHRLDSVYCVGEQSTIVFRVSFPFLPSILIASMSLVYNDVDYGYIWWMLRW